MSPLSFYGGMSVTKTRLPEAIFHLGDDLHHLRHHLLSNICFENLPLFSLAQHFSLQDINGLQQRLHETQSIVRNTAHVFETSQMLVENGFRHSYHTDL